MQPLVSVILPNYNYSRFLDERIESILSQSMQDFELILLDDASTDNSTEVLEKYASHPKVSHYVVNSTNSGSPFAQWQKGVSLAKGKYIWIAEADDSSTPEFLEKSITTMEANPNVVLCFTGSKAIDQNGEPLQIDFTRLTTKRMQKRIGSTLIHKGTDYIVHNMFWGCYVYNASATVFRRECSDADMFAQSMRMRNSGDWLFWTKLMERGDVAEIYESLNIIRRHQNTTTENGRRSGNLYLEDVDVMAYIATKHKTGLYRNIVRYGAFIKFIRRSQFPDEIKKQILDKLKRKAGAGTTYFRLERIHKFLWNIIPGLMSMQSDRL
jgi:glycosyltransferase involved in cell wall biosynthesis